MPTSLYSPLDMHLHLRDGDMLKRVAPLSAHSFSGALIMPNLIPPIATKEDVLNYKNRILEIQFNNPVSSIKFQNINK